MMADGLMPRAMEEMVEILRLDLTLSLLIAVAIGGAVGMERQLAGKPAGLRTNILICVGATLLGDLSIRMGAPSGRPGPSPSMLAAQVMSGIGFLGAGTIMKEGGTVLGLTSAATIWIVAAMGLALGAGHRLEAAGTAFIVLLTLAALGPLEHKLLRTMRVVPATIRAHTGTSLDVVTGALGAYGVKVRKVTTYDHPMDRVFEMVIAGPASQIDIVEQVMRERPDIFSCRIG
jgi:putative Mg2+ transporter-C (MgtC) family protein